jgi:hypothetical protein
MNPSNKKSKWTGWVIGIQTVLVLFFLLYAVVKKGEADDQRKLAHLNEQKAKDQERIALHEKEIAEEQKRLAEEQLVELKKCCSKK